jgi:hypothetical protein
MSLLIMFGKGHALLLVDTRFWQPPIVRQISGQNAGQLPSTIRCDASRITGQNNAGHPPVQLVKTPVNFRAIARRFPPSFRSISRILAPRYRQNSDDKTGAFARHFPVKFRASNSDPK